MKDSQVKQDIRGKGGLLLVLLDACRKEGALAIFDVEMQESREKKMSS